jgi:hypothetical protein
MRTKEEIIKAIQYRIKNLEKLMDDLEPLMSEKDELQSVYFDTYNRHEELSALMMFINKENMGGSCPPKSCRGCKTPCSDKTNE